MNAVQKNALQRLKNAVECSTGNHDWEELPVPINKDYKQKSPGKICLNCGKFGSSKKQEKPKISREEQAKTLYEKYIEKEHEIKNAGRGCHVLRSLGPYDIPPSPSTPMDD